MSPEGGRGGAQHIPRPADHLVGRPAPWADLAPDDRRPDLAAVRAAVQRFSPTPPDAAGGRDAAVLVALYEDVGPGGDGPGEPHVVLTRRAQHLRSHRGEVSFPGGGRDPGEGWVEAATREAHEEVGLDPALVEVVGGLDHLRTFSSRSSIVPVVGVLPGPPELEANPTEVERILHVGLWELLADGVFREEQWRLPSGYRPIWFFELVGDTIWGATARMLRQLLALAVDVEARDVEDWL